MPVSAGDVVLTFLGDTTQLDLAVDKVNVDTPAKLEPASLAIKEVAGSWQFAGSTASTAGEQALVAGTEMEEAGQQAAFSMREAKGEIALVGEEIGIKVPRHIRGFLAELPGVGAALNAAFSATAALILIQVLVEGTKKLAEFIGEHFIYTEALKEEYTQQLKLNGQIAEISKNLDAAKESYKRFGKDGAQIAQIEIDELTKKITLNEAAMRDASNTIFGYKNGMHGTAEEAKAAELQIALLQKTLEEQNQELTNLQLKSQQEQLTDYVKHGQSKVSAAKITGDALIALEELQSRLTLLTQNASYSDQLKVEKQFAEQKYELELSSLRQSIQLWSADPTKNADQIREANAKILALEREHAAQVVSVVIAGVEATKAALKSLSDAGKDGSIKIPLPDAIEVHSAFDTLLEAYQTLGIRGTGSLIHQLSQAQAAYGVLKTSGVSSMSDIYQAEIRLLSIERQLAVTRGESTKEIDKQLKTTVQNYNKATGAADNFGKHLHGPVTNSIRAYDAILAQSGNHAKAWGAALGEAITDVTLAYAQGSISIGQALEQVAAAQLRAIASIAEQKGTEQLAEAFGSWPDGAAMAHHFASAGLWFGLGGALSIGAAAASGSNNNSSTPQSVNPASGEAAAPIQSGPPTPTTKVTHFATGGLVTGRTMAMIGDSVRGTDQAEAAIPLDDPAAVEKIVQALGGGGGSVTHVHVKGLISGDNLGKVVKKIDRRVNRGQSRLTSSNSKKLTRTV